MAFSDVKDQLVRYCKADPTNPDDLADLEAAYPAAVAYLEGANIPEPKANTHRWHLWLQLVKYLVLDLYDRRDVKEPSSQATENITFRRTLNQLKWTPEEEEAP